MPGAACGAKQGRGEAVRAQDAGRGQVAEGQTEHRDRPNCWSTRRRAQILQWPLWNEWRKHPGSCSSFLGENNLHVARADCPDRRWSIEKASGTEITTCCGRSLHKNSLTLLIKSQKYFYSFFCVCSAGPVKSHFATETFEQQ